MNVYRVDISTWTSSFKYPNLISGFQPTLEVPPVSTVLGLLNAAAGRYLEHERLKIGYYFEYGGRQTDLETVYQLSIHDKGYPESKAKSNVMRREFLFDNRLSIYLTDPKLADYFRNPVYPLLLGRSGDLATVEGIQELELEEVTGATKVKGQIVPFAGHFLPGIIQSLPKYFTNELPRRNIGTEPYSVIGCNAPDVETSLTAYKDTLVGGRAVHIYFHDLDLTDDR